MSGGGNEASLLYGGKELEICFLYKVKGQQLVKAEFKKLPHLSIQSEEVRNKRSPGRPGSEGKSPLFEPCMCRTKLKQMNEGLRN